MTPPLGAATILGAAEAEARPSTGAPRVAPAVGGRRRRFFARFRAPYGEGPNAFYFAEVQGPRRCAWLYSTTRNDVDLRTGQKAFIGMEPTWILPAGSRTRWCRGRYAGYVAFLARSGAIRLVGRVAFRVR